MSLVPVTAAEVEVLLTADQWAARIRSHLAATVESIVAAGNDLIEAKAQLGHGRFERMVSDNLNISPRTARCFMSIASHDALSNRQHVADLPSSWGTLYELSRLETEALEQAIEAGDVRPDMERKAAQQLVARYRSAPPTPELRVVAPDVEDSDDDFSPADEPTPEVFPVIVIDPPWRYDNVATRGAAEDHYSTMSLDELAALELPAADNAHLYLWVTNGFLRQGFDLMDAWGFTYKTVLTWCKPQIGMGNWFRNSTEHVLFGVKGKLATQRNDVPTHFVANRTKHSAKPESFYDLVESCSPGPYLEMFARRRRFGWHVWGNEA